MNNNKYSRRALPSVSRDDSFVEKSASNPSWIDDFLGNLEKASTQSQSQAQRSIYDDISAIIGNTKPKFSNVEEAVKDLRDRTGLSALLQARASVTVQEPEIFKDIPEMKVFIDNYTADRGGTSVASVMHELMKLDSVRNKMPEGSDIGEDVQAYISRKIGETLSHNPDHNQVDLGLGKVDQSAPATTDDPLAICEPFKQQ